MSESGFLRALPCWEAAVAGPEASPSPACLLLTIACLFRSLVMLCLLCLRFLLL